MNVMSKQAYMEITLVCKVYVGEVTEHLPLSSVECQFGTIQQHRISLECIFLTFKAQSFYTDTSIQFTLTL